MPSPNATMVTCRHSIVWNAICAETKKPIILKGYVKVMGAEPVGLMQDRSAA